ncbi:hypothetical protein [Nonomuraea sp. NPDC048826]|uniref:hypothetical protein n=1 Tax=Nonomuraea sp. NPDC048826 TaxID=3364347 RepID=UPI00372242CC
MAVVKAAAAAGRNLLMCLSVAPLSRLETYHFAENPEAAKALEEHVAGVNFYLYLELSKLK